MMIIFIESDVDGVPHAMDSWEEIAIFDWSKTACDEFDGLLAGNCATNRANTHSSFSLDSAYLSQVTIVSDLFEAILLLYCLCNSLHCLKILRLGSSAVSIFE